MRLSKIKLAGFKTFVEPTTLLLPDSLVGIVGPNGCGKSNLVDAVRWVLGESRASALRGESMKDVIFNGSSLRKPVGRASVELVFDNAEGKISGMWGQYTEIAVRRVVEGDGVSTYSINGTTVRRRDMVDLFLGTGLGPRAYAIIEQGMISRIVEAKPEDLRSFIEEAAGVSKYKERRRETEARMQDTHSNLLRVEDILTTLTQQVNRLEAQAATAQKYIELRDIRRSQQQKLWALKLSRATRDIESQQKLVADVSLELESVAMHLKASEENYAAGRMALEELQEKTQALQNQHFSASSEVLRLENALKNQQEERSRLEAQQEELSTQHSKEEEHLKNQEKDLQDAQARLVEARAVLEKLNIALGKAKSLVPEAQARASKIEEEVSDWERKRAETEKHLHLEEAYIAHAERTLTSLGQRRAQLEDECRILSDEEDNALLEARKKLSSLEQSHKAAIAAESKAQQAWADAQKQHHQLHEAANVLNTKLAETQARHQALTQVQSELTSPSDLGPWLKKHGLSDLTPLWRILTVTPGWETALEAVLKEKLGAMMGGAWDDLLTEDPPATLTLVNADKKTDAPLEQASQPQPSLPSRGAWKILTSLFGKSRNEEAQPGIASFIPLAPVWPEDALRHQVKVDVAWESILDRWLWDVRACDDLRARVASQRDLKGTYVDRQGRMLTNHSLSFHVPDAKSHGVLERQRELNALTAFLSQLGAQVTAHGVKAEQAKKSVSELEVGQSKAREHVELCQQNFSAAQVEVARLEQQHSHRQDRLREAEQESVTLKEQQEEEQKRMAAASSKRKEAAIALSELDKKGINIKEQLVNERQALQALREEEQNAVRAAQEAEFSERQILQHITHIEQQHKDTLSRHGALGQRVTQVGEQLSRDLMATLAGQLLQAKKLQESHHGFLAEARRQQEEQAQTVKLADDERQKLNQQQSPLQEKLGAAKMKAQEATLNHQQFQERLQELDVSPEGLPAEALVGLSESALQTEITKMGKSIDAMGAVNLAAVEELEIARAEHEKLNAQDQDLRQALQTLQEAIQKIDRDTRAQLKDTFEKVNAAFSVLFPRLFGGGAARLELTADEILDAGITVMAQPPGKKNTTIHLLSGGEKALTAVSLVFAIFQLNPAPFCVLDEVDAPLDEVNTGHVCDLLREWCRHTQFIIITHNRMTMELAERLIGVTMSEPGVSRIVQVDVAEALRMRDAA